MTLLESALLYSKYLYEDAYQKIMDSDLLTEPEKEILTREYFISQLSGNEYYFPGRHKVYFKISDITNPVWADDYIKRLCQQIAVIPDPLLEIKKEYDYFTIDGYDLPIPRS